VPHCSFYGAEADFECILEFVFAELDCRVIEASSDIDKSIVEFSSLSKLHLTWIAISLKNTAATPASSFAPSHFPASPLSGARNGTRAYLLATIVSPQRDGASSRLIVVRFLVSAGEMFVVPKGVLHNPYAEHEVKLLLIEPRGIVNTGDEGGSRTAENDVGFSDAPRRLRMPS
jgi:hypothetical protein